MASAGGSGIASSSPCAAVGIEVRQQPIELVLPKAQKFEVEAVILQSRQLRRQQGVVPVAIQRDTIIGQPVGPSLRVREVAEPNDRHLLETEPLGREQTAMAGDENTAVIDQARHVESELRNRARDLRDLLVGMRAGVCGIGQQPCERPALDGIGEWKRHVRL